MASSMDPLPQNCWVRKNPHRSSRVSQQFHATMVDRVHDEVRKDQELPNDAPHFWRNRKPKRADNAMNPNIFRRKLELPGVAALLGTAGNLAPYPVGSPFSRQWYFNGDSIEFISILAGVLLAEPHRDLLVRLDAQAVGTVLQVRFVTRGEGVSIRLLDDDLRGLAL